MSFSECVVKCCSAKCSAGAVAKYSKAEAFEVCDLGEGKTEVLKVCKGKADAQNFSWASVAIYSL